VIIGRDLVLLVGVAVIHFTVGKVAVQPRLTGKIATVFQMLSVVWILLQWDFHRDLLKIWILGAGIFTVVSGLLYLFDGIRQLGSHPASSPIKN
jgi:phosphatidylglycerophosphate synthase